MDHVTCMLFRHLGVFKREVKAGYFEWVWGRVDTGIRLHDLGTIM